MRPRDLPEIQRALTQAATEHRDWRRRYLATAGLSDLLTVTELLHTRLPLAELYLVSQPMRDVALDASRDVPSGVRMGDAMIYGQAREIFEIGVFAQIWATACAPC